jgi:uroporphyrinogen-III synthase
MPVANWLDAIGWRLQLENAGLQVLQTVAYVRQAPVLTVRSKAWLGRPWAMAALGCSAVPRRRSISCRPAPICPLAQARALATHPRIAQRLQQMGWGRVEWCLQAWKHKPSL